MEAESSLQASARSPNDTSHPATPPPAGPDTAASGPIDIAALLSSATIASSTRRRIFTFDRNESTPPPEAGPSSRPASLSVTDGHDSDLESLPELPGRARPSTPENSNTIIKISSSQRKADGKDRHRALSEQSGDEDDSDIEFVGYKVLSPRQVGTTPPREFPASQAILNSARRRSATPETEFTPRKREGYRKARPSASYAQRRSGLDDTYASVSLSPSAAMRTTGEKPASSKETRSLSPPRQIGGSNSDRESSLQSIARVPHHPDFNPGSSSNVFFDGVGEHYGLDKSSSTRIVQHTWESFAPDDGAPESVSEADELERSPSPTPATSVSNEQEGHLPLLEMTMDDIRPVTQYTPLHPVKPDKLSLQIPSMTSAEGSLPSSMPLTPPDIIVTESSNGGSTSTFKPADPVSFEADMDMDISGVLQYEDSDDVQLLSISYFPGGASHEPSSESENDSEPTSPLRRRDVLIISENKSRRQKDVKQRIRRDLEPDLLFSSADSGTSAEPERRRRNTPIDLTRPIKRSKTRKIREESQPLWYRHRDAIVWTGREIEGEFPYEELDLIRSSCKDSHHMDSHNRARFESLVNDQLAREEPRAPRIRVKDPKSTQSCPPFDFVYTNRLIYRDKVPLPTKAAGCNCVDGCRPDNPDCRCLRRQIKWTKTFPQGANFHGGFAYDAKGRLILPEEIPIIECNSNCGCPADCMNRQVSNGRRYGLDLIKTAEKGWGVEAASDRPSIRKGSFLCIYSGEVITWQEAERRGLDNNDQINPVSYLFDIDSSFIARTMHAFEQDGFQIIGDATLPANSSPQAVESQTERFDNNKSLYTVDAMHFGNVGRFFNHACSPNGSMRSVFCDDADEFKPILAVFAKKKIYPGEEITISYRGGDVEGASGDHDSSTDEDGHGVNGCLTPRRQALTGARNKKRRKKSWRMQNQGARRKGKGGRRKKAGGKAKQAGRVNPQAANTPFSVVTAECQCGAINCDGYMFNNPDDSDPAADV